MYLSRAPHAAVASHGRGRTLRLSVVLAVIASLLAVVSGAFAAGATGGSVRVFGIPKGGGGPVMFTGAIGDYGTTQRETASGTPDANGNFVKFTLKHGTFVGDGTGLFNSINHAKFSFSSATCSGFGSGSGPVTLSAGTGEYAGISGSFRVTVTFAEVGPRLKNGRCNMKQNAKPLAQTGAISGSGHVSLG
jgi:hypothetical protein